MGFILLKTLDDRDFISNTANILTIETRDTAIDLHVQRPAVTTSIWNGSGLQKVFSITVERGTAKQKAIELAKEINAAEKSGELLDLRDRIFSATGFTPTPLPPGVFR